jgi:hypothetical protein
MALFLADSKKNAKMTDPENFNGKGKQTIQQLTQQGAGVSNIEIRDGNIKDFEKVARRYGVDFAVVKDKTEKPPKWLVFFKGRDADAITAAFKEFMARHLRRNADRPSIIGELNEMAGRVNDQVLDITRNMDRGRSI